MATSSLIFEPVRVERQADAISRPALSYWEDAWVRLKANKRALVSLYIVIGLALFTLAGPWIWRVDPTAQDLDQLSAAPGADRSAMIVEPYTWWPGVMRGDAPMGERGAPATIRLAEPATTQAVRIAWDAVPNAAGYRIYRNISDPKPDDAMGLPIADLLNPERVSFEDRLDLRVRRYFYSVIALDISGREAPAYTTLRVDVSRVITMEAAIERGLAARADNLRLGDIVQLAAHPLGTDYLGRDMLARLMYGARISLFIGIVAPFLYVL
ncbi:MAG: hypothetical protein O7H39_00745, partial [Gammaproteobacteria bacterium]|nr:hypothetical protein [Gammaproteobacteria bacterium]